MFNCIYFFAGYKQDSTMFKRGLKARYVRFMLKSKAWRVPLKLFKWRKSKSKTDYNLVSDDENDLEIPLHPDEAFEYGITFGAKVSFEYEAILFM